MPATPAIETIGLTKRYGGVTAVDDLSLNVEQGEVFGFLGPNGSGKTTTVKLILGLVAPTGGEINVLGRPMAGHRRELLGQIGAMVEAPAFYPFLSGRENLIVLAKMAGIEEERVGATLERVGLADAASRPFDTYSMGMKQRLAIAASLLRRPRLVLLDEPTNGLDPAGQREIRGLIPHLADDGCTVFMSSHVMHEVQGICDRVAIMRRGRLQRIASVEQLLHAEQVVEIRVDDPAPARELLVQVEWVAGVEQDGNLLVVQAPADRSADLNRLLAGQGIFASEIRTRERSLEDVYFETTRDQAA